MNRSNIASFAALAAGLAATAACADTPSWPRPLADYAGGIESCIAIYEPAADSFVIHGLAQCEEPLSPCSTFKVPNALAGLESGVLAGVSDLKAWDGTRHERDALNRDHDLTSAMQHSVVWYFQDVALDVGPERMQAFLDAWDYGNRDISGGQDRFWLGSTLQITALEQIRFMRALAAGTLQADEANQAVVRSVIRQSDSLPEGFRGDLYGKTGSCPGEAFDHGWFTGFLHRDGRQFVFAVNVKGRGHWGWDARRIAVEVLQDLR